MRQVLVKQAHGWLSVPWTREEGSRYNWKKDAVSNTGKEHSGNIREHELCATTKTDLARSTTIDATDCVLDLDTRQIQWKQPNKSKRKSRVSSLTETDKFEKRTAPEKQNQSVDK